MQIPSTLSVMTLADSIQTVKLRNFSVDEAPRLPTDCLMSQNMLSVQNAAHHVS